MDAPAGLSTTIFLVVAGDIAEFETSSASLGRNTKCKVRRYHVIPNRRIIENNFMRRGPPRTLFFAPGLLIVAMVLL